MNYTRLTDYQLNAIESRLQFLPDSIEGKVLDKYKAYALDALRASDYDAIIEDIQQWTVEVKGL